MIYESTLIISQYGSHRSVDDSVAQRCFHLAAMTSSSICQLIRLPIRSSFSCHSSIPSEACLRHATSQRTFCTSPTHLRRTKDNNKNRGVSLMRGTGYRERQTQLRPNPDRPLPEPVLDRAKRTKVKVDEDHGLWAFFPKSKQSMAFDKDELNYGA